MIERRRLELLRSAGMRFALIYAGLFAASTLILLWFTWWATAGFMTRALDQAIRTDLQAFGERYADGGLPALLDTIKERVDRNLKDDALYLLTDPALQPLAGNLDHWPARLPEVEVPGMLHLPRLGSNRARVEHFILPGGFHLLIGRDTQARDEMVSLMTQALLWESGIMLVLGLAGAAMVNSLFRLTLADVSRTTAAIGAGDLSRRMPITGRGDEFDLLAETINDMLDRIGLLMDGVRNVSNAIAHDLRTPITRARARLEYAARAGAGEPELRAAIERAQADLDAVVRVFQALLRIAEIESGSRRSAFARFDLAGLLEDLAETYAVVAEEASQTLIRAVPASLPVFGDREMIQQAVANLLDNALKFSPPGGVIELAARLEGDVPAIIVADHGPGMSEADRANAGRRFFRAESARSTPGSGLGLALVQAVAILHGGSFRLEDSNPGLRAVLRLSTMAAHNLATKQPTATGVPTQRSDIDASSSAAQPAATQPVA